MYFAYITSFDQCQLARLYSVSSVPFELRLHAFGSSESIICFRPFQPIVLDVPPQILHLVVGRLFVFFSLLDQNQLLQKLEVFLLLLNLLRWLKITSLALVDCPGNVENPSEGRWNSCPWRKELGLRINMHRQCLAMVTWDASHLVEAFTVLPLHIRSCPNTVEVVVLPRLDHTFVHLFQPTYHDRDQEVQHQDDHNHLVDAPEGHRHQMRKLHGELFLVLVSHLIGPVVVLLYEHLVRAVSIDVSPKEDVEE